MKFKYSLKDNEADIHISTTQVKKQDVAIYLQSLGFSFLIVSSSPRDPYLE